MKILGIDTSSKRCSVCILEDTNKIIELHSDDERTHSQKLMPLINDLFQKSNMTLKDIDIIACSIGPGSFTGVRIGISTAKAFSDALNKQAIGISSLESLAYNAKDNITNNDIVCSVIDAKNDNVYFGIFDNNFNKLEDLSTCSIDELVSKLRNYNSNILFIGDGGITYKEIFKNNFNERAKFAEEEKNLASSISIAELAYNKYVNNTFNASLSPLYLRKSQAERSLEERKDC